MELYDRIRQLRISRGMSQEELAKRLGYKSRASINKIELGKCDIAQSKIVAFAKVLGTSPAYLMGWIEEDVNPDEKDIIERIQKLSPANRSKLSELIDLFLSAQDNIE